ncbi:transcriptional regulator, LysR family [Treponema primitia ZAS-2]|uniref:Transcriptional regulator, LysR family n=1 Tax=Treponema primitia (strain ATCC BAA-887 / DSM 12427 / ZAS-2) TaxID=545694 RepID=F5YKA4_TREPZ|nr:LysR family transcriptional regulator [Treponema primitia]AEF85486.1 transcriptional regulator, LysR family [Treponema primitia ZAS-2]
MDFRELSYIVSIAKQQNITRASEEVYVSQPTLSKFVQNLENYLGQPLFRRLGNKFLLTYAGELYVEKAKAMLAMKKELDQELSDIIRQNIGELKIAFPIMRGNYMLPCTLPVFRKEFPRVKVSIHEANSSVMEDMILGGEIDIAFFTLPIKHPDISYDIINLEEILLIMSPDHPLASAGIPREGCKYPWIDIGLLRDEEFIIQRSDQRTRQIFDKIFHNAGFDPRIAMEIRNIQASVQLASGGFGMTFVGETHLRHIRTDVNPACFSVGTPRTTTSFVAAYRRGIYLPNYAQRFVNIVREFT